MPLSFCCERFGQWHSDPDSYDDSGKLTSERYPSLKITKSKPGEFPGGKLVYRFFSYAVSRTHPEILRS